MPMMPLEQSHWLESYWAAVKDQGGEYEPKLVPRGVISRSVLSRLVF
jgi:hypothetical protein